MRYTLDEAQCRNLDVSSRREWLLTNGIGGFAMGSVSGINTRRYHGHLVSAIKPPTQRMVLLAGVEAYVQAEGTPVGLSANQYPGTIHPQGYQHLKSFSVDSVARWRWKISWLEIEKTVALHRGSNAVTVRYRNLSKRNVKLSLQPLISHKDYHGNFIERDDYPEQLLSGAEETVARQGAVTIWLGHKGAEAIPTAAWYYRCEHQREIERGLPERDDLFCPVELHYDLAPGQEAILVASSDGPMAAVETADVSPEQGPFDPKIALADATEPFRVAGGGRQTLLAGYPWFTDWGRDTMISLPGACLATGKIALARQILRDYAGQMRDGLIPNRFVEEGEEPEYHTVDATLWFAQAVAKTLAAEWDAYFAEEMLEKLDESLTAHIAGTRFSIRCDPADGLLSQGEPGVQLTWMDAKIGDWVVTPRTGKAIEICGLWVDALSIGVDLAEKLGQNRQAFRDLAALGAENFDRTFWNCKLGYYLDVAEPTDASLRPNQVIALSLPHCPASPDHAREALGVVARELLTPVGLRTLAPWDAAYRGRFEGPMQNLDASYHQGTVWPWLLGPYVTALVKWTGDKREGRRILREVKYLLVDQGLGGIAEVYDGDKPHMPGGCPWQSWSVAEMLRAWVEDLEGGGKQIN
jgi:predicted glycogen debranching enzyme